MTEGETTARLTLRPLGPDDAPALHAIVSDLAVVRELGPFWWPLDFDKTASRARPHIGDGFVWGLFEGDTLIGSVGVTGGEIGYMLRQDRWGRGLAREAATAALDRAFGPMALQQVGARVWADNAPSLALLHRLGFVETGRHTEMAPARGVRTAGVDLRLDSAAWRALRGQGE
ncbi:GNAT family N-acetyltransferase [Roseisalinus antarcticus]|uniref:N-acetyltransferase domain-containing protein n=1 Tax=Roseisalinus antarcticus TaxID=254357 RepID=A0A1Y5TDD6_9RHOB|nr:GNAT family N-acetyltransferase [Roseisalinus antarcticus]SLN59455.1 hypothetical protein ROA7023_02726 [Roseisalinus antarcticus]